MHSAVYQIKNAGKMASVAINPATPIAAVEEILPDLDQVIVMTVNPGFGGQRFIASMLDKIARLRMYIDERELGTSIEVDGGINLDTASAAAHAGAQVLVAGSAVYNDRMGVAESIKRLRDVVSDA